MLYEHLPVEQSVKIQFHGEVFFQCHPLPLKPTPAYRGMHGVKNIGGGYMGGGGP